MQEKFRDHIHGFAHIVATTQKLLQAAQAMQIPVVASTQSRQKLGGNVTELELDTKYKTVAHIDKTLFSMWTPEVEAALKVLPQKAADVSKDTTMKRAPFDIIIVGIETHICVLQTSLDALKRGHRVWIVKDGVSSVNQEERHVALDRARQEGARITTSESIIYECLGDASDPA